MAVQYDVTADPQIVLTLQGPRRRFAPRLPLGHGPKIVRALEQAERDRANDPATNASANRS